MFVVALVLHGQTVTFDFSYLDDDVLIVNNRDLTKSGSLWRAFARPYFQTVSRDHAYYRPLVSLSYSVDAASSGRNASGYHLTNVLLHAIATGLLFLLLYRMGHRQNTAAFGALLFAAHPALTQSVAWIPGRNDTLVTVFALAAWFLLLPGYPSGSSHDGRGVGVSSSGRLRRFGHLGSFLGALLSKETAIVLPLVWIAHLCWTEGRPWRTVMRSSLTAGWGAVLVLYLTLRHAVMWAGIQAPAGGEDLSVLGGISAGGLSATRILANLPLLLKGFGKLMLPVQLSVLAIPEDTWWWPGLLAVCSLLAAAFVFRVRRRQLFFGAACVMIFLSPSLPASNLLVLESRLYLPAIGMVFAACELARGLAWPVRAKVGLGVTLLLLLSVVTINYGRSFRDRRSFAEAAVLGSPRSSLAHRNLGITYQLAGDAEAARLEYEAALAQDPGEPTVHNNLGVLLMAKGQLADAERALRQELASNPRYAPAHRNLALILEANGRPDDAARHWESSLAGVPEREDIRALRALVSYYGSRDPQRAVHFRSQLERAESVTAR